jgi:hypothetical protein
MNVGSALSRAINIMGSSFGYRQNPNPDAHIPPAWTPSVFVVGPGAPQFGSAPGAETYPLATRFITPPDPRQFPLNNVPIVQFVRPATFQMAPSSAPPPRQQMVFQPPQRASHLAAGARNLQQQLGQIAIAGSQGASIATMFFNAQG